MKKLFAVLVVVSLLFAGLAGCSNKGTSAKESESDAKMDVKWKEFVKHYNERADFSDMDPMDEDNDKYIMNNTVVKSKDGFIKEIYKAPSDNKDEARVIIKTLIDLVDKDSAKTLSEVLKHFDKTVDGDEDMFYIQKEIGNKEILIMFGEDDYSSLSWR